MAKILISSESRFPINRKSLREIVDKFLLEQKIKSEVEISITVVGDRKMQELNKKYRKFPGTTPVLSFSLEEGKPFPALPDQVLRLGDIVISYPQVVDLAASENKLVDEELAELVKHGLINLLGL